jgi:hypothetical protein
LVAPAIATPSLYHWLPVVDEEVSVTFPPIQKLVDPLEVIVGRTGIALTVASVVDAGLVQPFSVTVTEYTPLAAVVALAMEGFCCDETNPLGPVQL